jgi:calcineurin-like phosphoesterase family protein
MNPEKIYFTADPHYYHRGILKYCPDRPWTDVGLMNDALVELWNKTVPADAHVFCVGDMFFAGAAKALPIMATLNGRKYLIKGNHDAGMNQHVQGMFEWVKDYHEMKVLDSRGVPLWINLFHYPLATWNRMHYGSWMLHGHTHGGTEPNMHKFDILDVGVDSALMWLGECRPFSFAEVYDIMSKQRGEQDV